MKLPNLYMIAGIIYISLSVYFLFNTGWGVIGRIIWSLFLALGIYYLGKGSYGWFYDDLNSKYGENKK